MKEKLAKTLSVLFHPLFMPTFGLILLFSFDNLYGFFPPVYKWFNILVIVVFTLLIPLISFWILMKTGQISDINIRDKNERLVPMILTFLSYAAAYILLLRFKVPQIVTRFVLGGVLTLLISGTITPFWKISAHMTGIGGFAGAVFMFALVLNQNLSPMVSFIILMGGSLGWARMQLKAHTLLQVTAGFWLGFLTMIAVFWSIA
ncbi:hypothetical protein ACE1ET_19435 [Saccharicrinis sp. FJH62]|uniref:hypothetical protein n=1 Tax=Saccharicrinis sp. FJH62 TaxID=3344657 RepID=UPI0035D40D33